MVNQVSDLTKETWDMVYQMPVVAFLNICAYNRDKTAVEKEQLDNIKTGKIKRY
jgi:Iap family predicted aminopeptidase